MALLVEAVTVLAVAFLKVPVELVGATAVLMVALSIVRVRVLAVAET